MLCKETPLSKAVNSGENEIHCLSTFRLKHEASLLDFTNIPEPYILNVPDYFAYRFIYDFQNAITQYVGDSEYEKPKYVPTLALQNEIELYNLSTTFDDMAIVKKMKEIVPEYRSNQSKYKILDK